MNACQLKSLAAAFGLAVAAVLPAQAAIIVSEVAPWSSGNSPLAADWFEVTNTGASAVNIAGWKFDDNSNSFAASLLLNGITSIAAGESVIFIESAAPATVVPAFISLWFGASAPAGLQIGTYTGAGAGLSTAGDAVNIFNGAGALQANVIFGASPAAPGPYATFDNAAGLTGAISAFSAVGVNGAFLAAADAAEIGSPGTIAAVPEAGSLAMMALGLAALAGLRRSRR
jgi:hypothetical protein